MVEAREEDTPAPRPADTLARRLREHLWRIIVTTTG
jgi:membrane protein